MFKIDREKCIACKQCIKELISCLVIGYPDVKYQRTVPRKDAVINWI